MLIITRKSGQSVMLGDDIEVFVSEISGDRVKLGFNATKDVKILRKELFLTQEINKQAVSSSSKNVHDLVAFLKK